MVHPAVPDARRAGVRLALETLALDAAAAALRRVDRCWKGLDKEEDIEAVHRLRTGTNRLRSLLKLCGPVVAGPQAREIEKNLQKWQKSWGPVRDLDVLILHLDGWTGAMDEAGRETAAQVLAIFRRRRAALYKKAMKEIGKKRGKQARETLNRLKAWAQRRRRALKRKAATTGKNAGEQEAAKTGTTGTTGNGADAADGPRATRAAQAEVQESMALLWPEALRLWKGRKAAAEKAFHGLVLHKFRLANKRLRHVLQLYKPHARPEWLDLLATVEDLHETIGLLHDVEVLLAETETLSARWAQGRNNRESLQPAQALHLLGFLDARRRETFGHVLDLWKRLNQPDLQAILADPLSPTRPVTPPPRNGGNGGEKARRRGEASGETGAPPGKKKAAAKTKGRKQAV